MIQNRNSYNNLQYKIQGNELIPIKKELEKLDGRVTSLEECCEELHDELVTEKVITDCLQVNGDAYIGNIESEGVHCACCFKGNYADIEDADICRAHIHCACIDNFHFDSTTIDNLTVENTLCVCGDSNFSNVNADNVTAGCFCGKATCADIADYAANADNSTCFAGCTEQEWHDYISGQIPTCAADSAKFAGCTCDEWKTIIKETCVDNAATATNSECFGGKDETCWCTIIKGTKVDCACYADSATNSVCFGGKDETCWCTIIKGTKVDCACYADSANDSTCFDGYTYACAKADILSGTANNATCFNGKDETCWCNIIKGTKVDNATCADSATNSACFNGCTYACAKADILSGTANNANCFDGKTSACWCSIIKGTKVDEASHADVACDIDNAPVLCACNKCVNVTVGSKTSNNFTVPYSTCAELVCIDSVSDNANLQIPLVGTQTPYTQLHRDNNSGILFNPGCNALCVCNVEVKTNLTSCRGTFTCDLCSCGGLNINGNANIGGDLAVAGTICCVHTEEIDTSCDNIHLRYDATTAISPGCYSGLVITKYDGTNNLEVGVDCEGTLKIGTDPSNMEAVETRDCSSCMEDGYVEKWDATDKKACTKGTSCTHDLCINGNATATGNITAACFCGKATSADNADNATSAGSACYADKMTTHYITGNQDMYPTFTYCYTSQTCQTIATDKDIKYNPSTNTFTVPTVCATSCICGNLKGNVCGDVTGNLTGNADTATDSTCFGGKTEACWCNIIKGTKVDCASCADSATSAGSATTAANATCFDGKTSACWCSIIKGTKVDCAACADSATNSACFNGCTYACAKADILTGCAADSAKFAGCTYDCAKADILSGKAACACCADSATTAGSSASSTDSTCFAGKNETCWCSIIKSTCVDNANYATSAGSATNASNVIPIAASANEEKNVAFFNVDVASGNANTIQFDCDKKITYNPSTNVLTVPTVCGSVSGTFIDVKGLCNSGSRLRFYRPGTSTCKFGLCVSQNSDVLRVYGPNGNVIGYWTTGGYCGTVSCAVSACSITGTINMDCVTNASLCISCCLDNTTCRKIIMANRTTCGYITRVGIGLCRGATAGWGKGVLSVGCNDGGTCYYDYCFDSAGIISGPNLTVCGNLCGNAATATTATCATLNAYDNCGTKSLIVGGTNELGTVSCLTYNTCTCTMYNKGAEFGEYQLTIPSANGVYRYVLVDLGNSHAPNVKAQTYNTSFNINKSNSATSVYGDNTYGITGYAHLGTESTPSNCLWLKVTGCRPFRFSGSYPMSVVCNTTTDPGCTWVAPKVLASVTDLVCCACCAESLYDYAYTGNCDRNVMITNGPSGCYTHHGYSTNCPLTFNPATGDLCARAFCGCVHATGEIDCAKCITRMQATTGTCHLAMFSGKTCVADAQAYVSNGCELTYQPATGTLTAPIFCGSLCGTAKDSTCFNGCTYAQACSNIRSGLISDIGVSVYCGTTCKCSLTKSSSLCLSANAFNANATISTSTYPGACCTGTLTEKCTVFGNVRVVEQGSIAFICASCSFVGCDMYKALCCVVGSNSVMYVNGYMPSLGNICQLRCLTSTCYSIDGTSQTQQFTSTQTGTVTQRHTMITIMK